MLINRVFEVLMLSVNVEKHRAPIPTFVTDN